MELESKIEGLLFYKNEELKIDKLASLLDVSVEQINEALAKLENSLSSRGIVLMRKNDSVILGVNSELSPIIETIRKDEISKELTKASLETLSIILYKNNVSRSEIDYIRGVNSSFILRNLLVRGLIEKIVDPKDTRRMLYRPSLDALSFMGITSIDKLPNYEEIQKQLQDVINIEQPTND